MIVLALLLMIDFSSLPSVTPDHETHLRRQEITDDEPGPLLRDVDTLLDAVQDGGVPVSTSRHALSGSVLPDLNELMTHTLDTAYERIGQSAFPPLGS